jgi:hypothetical protein
MDTQETSKLLEAGTGYDEQQALTPMELIQVALNQKADIGHFERLMALQERWEANRARRGFVMALNAFKADAPEILKNQRVDYTTRDGDRVSYDHATLDNVCRAATQGLSKHGISHRWTIVQNGDGLIRVTCILTHDLGHSEETTMVSGADQSGKKNAIQAIASAVTYLERYTLLAATGLAAANTDNDARGVDAPMETLQVHLDRIAGSENKTQLKRAFTDAFSEASALKNTTAMQTIMEAKDKAKARLSKGEPDAKAPA